MVVLDVFIGLVFIYFLYSLFVSIIAELFSTWMGMRARILRQGIDNFLNDKEPHKESNRKGFISWMHDLFLVEHVKFRYTSAGQFYNEPTIKYLAKVGENKRYSIKNTKPAYIEKSHFVSAIVSMLQRRSIGVNEWDKVKFAIENNTLNLEKETLQMFQDWMTQSNDSYNKFKAHIGNSYEEVNDRLVGWYKRKISVLLFVFGLVLSFIMNVDTFELVNTLANNPDKRMALVDKAIAASESETFNVTTLVDSIALDSAYHNTKKSIDDISNLLGSGWQHTALKEKKGFMAKASFLWSETNPLRQKFWGFIITAFALSMGAKFWFDLLKRLVSLRGSGEKPDEHNINKTDTIADKVISDNGLKMNTDDPAVIALSENRKKWEAQPGFVAANVRYTESNEGFILLTFEKDRAIDKMPKTVKNPLNPTETIKLEYQTGTKGSFEEDDKKPLDGALIQSTTNNWGTPAGIVMDRRTNSEVILTCGHVIRNDKTAFIDNTKSKIFYQVPGKNESIEIGEAKNLVLSSFCDAGIVAVNKNLPTKINGLPKINKVREVSIQDRFKTEINIHTLREDPANPGTRLNVKGKILFTGESRAFNDHPSSDIRFYDLFMIGDIDDNNTEALTLAGDSGALITDNFGNQIGVLVGAVESGGKHFSYGIKLTDIFDILQLDPINNEEKNIHFA